MIDNIEVFKEAVRAVGLRPPDVIEAGKIHRFPGIGKRKGLAGWCKVFPDGAGGVFGDYSTGLSEHWQLDRGQKLSSAEKSRFNKMVAAAKKEAAAARKQEAEQAAAIARKEWHNAKPAGEHHPYLVKKKLTGSCVDGLRQKGVKLLVPLLDIDGQLWALQTIDQYGGKLFHPKGCGTAGRLCWIGPAPSLGVPVCIVEGWATGAVVHESTGYPVAVAFNAGNLEAVARIVVGKYPTNPVVVCADDDQKEGTNQNPGVEAARKAARAVSGAVAIPDAGCKADFWDIWDRGGPGVVLRTVNRALEQASEGWGQQSDPEKSGAQEVPGKQQKTSSFSLSGGYPSFHHSFQEKIPRFRGVLTTLTKDGKEVLVQQSTAARLISEVLRGHYAYNEQGACWHVFDGRCWRVCPTGLFDQAVTALLYTGAEPLGFSNTYHAGVVQLVQKGGRVRLPECAPGCIPFTNGLFDPATGELVPVSPGNAATWVLPFPYSPLAQCPFFLSWLNRSVDGDQATVQLLRAWLHALIVGRPDLQIFLHLIGPAGTGKSTFGRLAFFLVGNENATTTTIKQLETNRFETANVFGKRLVAIEEADKYGGSVCVLKAMTGQDPLRLERKGQQQQGSFIFGGQVLLMSNERMATTDYTSGIERRRVTVMFTRMVTWEERRRWESLGGEERLYSEAAGIVRWALEMERGQVAEVFRGKPERVRLANLAASRFNNPVLDWMVNCLAPDPDSAVRVGVKEEMRIDGEVVFRNAEQWLYPNYLRWCGQSGREFVSLQRFSAVLGDAAQTLGVTLTKKREANGVHVYGVRVVKPGELSWLDIVEQPQNPPL